jgi:ethanolaminephosphotransferase
VLRAKRTAGEPTIQPLVGLLPFALLVGQHALWLLWSPAADGLGILHSGAFLPFACAWGLQFAHAVGRVILAHLTRGPFPMFDAVTLVSALGAADAALPALLGVYVPALPALRALARS